MSVRGLGRVLDAGRVVAIAAAALLAAAAPAPAATSLTYTWSDIRCGVTAPDGSSTAAACTQPSFSAMVEPGGSVFVTATLAYTYRDDGLPLDPPGAFQIDSMGRMLFTSHEAGALYLTSNQCRDQRGHCDAPYRTEFRDDFDGPDYLLLGHNDHPDSFAGQVTYTARSSVIATWPQPATTTAFMGVYRDLTYSGVPAIPEPSTTALLGVGVLAVAGWMRRRTAQAR